MDANCVYGVYEYEKYSIKAGKKILYTNIRYINDDYEYHPQRPNYNIYW